MKSGSSCDRDGSGFLLEPAPTNRQSGDAAFGFVKAPTLLAAQSGRVVEESPRAAVKCTQRTNSLARLLDS